MLAIQIEGIHENTININLDQWNLLGGFSGAIS